MVFYLATVKTGICPICLKDRQLAKFEFGIIKTTLCPHCLKRYLDEAVLPRLVNNNNYSSEILISEVQTNE